MGQEQGAPGAWSAIASFPSVVDVALVEAAFRDQDIPYRLRDALSVQVAPHMSAALGGIRLEVPVTHREAAIDVLLDMGIDQLEAAPGNPLLERFDQATAAWPWFGRMEVGRRSVVLAAIVLLIGAVVAWWWSSRNADPLAGLTDGAWCVRRVELDGAPVDVRTTGLVLRWAGCEEELRFHADRSVQWPGLGTRGVWATWHREGAHVRISLADTLDTVYEGLYAVRIHRTQLELRSARLWILADRGRGFSPLAASGAR